MTVRNDLIYDYSVSPRVITVQAPSSEIIQQDLVDTVRVEEERIHGGMAFEKLLNASGKDDLGGGVSVGITVSLQNALLSFEARRTPESVGTVTTASGSVVKGRYTFSDSSATFITDGVERGATVINFTDQSVADVYEVVSQTELLVTVLVNGTDNLFEIGDNYQVYNIEQMIVRGGNLVAVDENGLPFESPILPSAFTQVVLTSSASATLQESEAIQRLAYEGGVTLDLSAAINGSGTAISPSNNLADAVDIATAQNFDKIYLKGTTPLAITTEDVSGLQLQGQSITGTVISVAGTADTANTVFTNADVTGTFNANASFEDCIIRDVTVDYLFVRNCLLAGTITLNNAGSTMIYNTRDLNTGTSPVINFNNQSQTLNMKDYIGNITLRNKNQANNVVIDLATGTLILENTVTAGSIVVRGIGTMTDNSVGATVDDNNFIFNAAMGGFSAAG